MSKYLNSGSIDRLARNGYAIRAKSHKVEVWHNAEGIVYSARTIAEAVVYANSRIDRTFRAL